MIWELISVVLVMLDILRTWWIFLHQWQIVAQVWAPLNSIGPAQPQDGNRARRNIQLHRIQTNTSSSKLNLPCVESLLIWKMSMNVIIGHWMFSLYSRFSWCFWICWQIEFVFASVSIARESSLYDLYNTLHWTSYRIQNYSLHLLWNIYILLYKTFSKCST